MKSLADKVQTIKYQKKPAPTEQTLRKSLEQQSKTRDQENAKSLSKMEIIKAYQMKRRRELWCKALSRNTFEEVLASAN